MFGMKIVIGLSKGSSKSYALSAENGKRRVSFTRIDQVRMAYIVRARDVHIKLPKSLVREGRL